MSGCSKCRHTSCGRCRTTASTALPPRLRSSAPLHEQAYSAREPASGGIALIGDGEHALQSKLRAGTIVFGPARARSNAPCAADHELGIVVGDVAGDESGLYVLFGSYTYPADACMQMHAPAGHFRPDPSCARAQWARQDQAFWRRLSIVGVVDIDGEGCAVTEWNDRAVDPPCFYKKEEAEVLARSAAKLRLGLKACGRGAKRGAPGSSSADHTYEADVPGGRSSSSARKASAGAGGPCTKIMKMAKTGEGVTPPPPHQASPPPSAREDLRAAMRKEHAHILKVLAVLRATTPSSPDASPTFGDAFAALHAKRLVKKGTEWPKLLTHKLEGHEHIGKLTLVRSEDRDVLGVVAGWIPPSGGR